MFKLAGHKWVLTTEPRDNPPLKNATYYRCISCGSWLTKNDELYGGYHFDGAEASDNICVDLTQICADLIQGTLDAPLPGYPDINCSRLQMKRALK
jgi:hypothetical protein